MSNRASGSPVSVCVLRPAFDRANRKRESRQAGGQRGLSGGEIPGGARAQQTGVLCGDVLGLKQRALYGESALEPARYLARATLKCTSDHYVTALGYGVLRSLRGGGAGSSSR